MESIERPLYLIMPGGKVPVPDWYKPKAKSTKSIPGRRSDRIQWDGFFDPPA